ncbi:MAG: type IV secretion system DNA-binding domain-containing protein [Symploca sp. SIO1B1]|nr:type IV secretion system DNA-binding domain-containing protein [Symploca sp. SIO1B1]
MILTEKFFLWGVVVCLAALAVPLIFSLGSTVAAKTITLFGLEFYNPNNILGSTVGALCVLALTKEILSNATLFTALYKDVANHIAAAVFKSPYALARTPAVTYQQAWEQLKIFVYPKLKILAGSLLIILVFTVVFPLPLALLAAVYLASVAVDVISEGQNSWNSVVRGFARRDGKDLAKKWVGKNVSNLIPWGASFIPKKNEALHFLILGVTGAGKSIWKEIMMRRTVPGNKVIVNDPKLSQADGMVTLLEGLGVNYYILNPFDFRCTAWHIFRDVEGEAMVIELVAYLLPIKESSDGRFFDEAARLALAMIIVALQNVYGEELTLRLVILFTEKPYFELLIKKYHPRPHEFDEFLKAKKIEGERNDILLTLQARMKQYNVIASLWERAPQKLAFKDFVQDSFPKSSAIIMGSDPIHSELMNQVNSMMFAFAAKYLKALPPNKNRRIWLYLDESASEQIPPWLGIESIMALGRGAGISCCLCFHNISLLKRTYKELVALGIFALARHKAIFGVDTETSEFLSKSLGNYEYIETSYSSSVTTTPQGTNYSQTTNTRLGSRPVYLPQEFQDMNRPPTGVVNGLLGDFIAPGEGIHRHHYTWEEVKSMLPERSQEVEAYQRIPDTHPATILQPLSDDELRSWLPEAIEIKAAKPPQKNTKGKRQKRRQHQ